MSLRHKNKHNTMTQRLAIATTATLLALTSGTALAFKASISGQVDRALTYADNGKRSDYGSVDNTGTNSRFRFTGSQMVDDGITAGIDYEFGVDQMASINWDIGQNSNGNTHFNTRLIDTYFQGDFGKISFGKGDGAAFYANTMDLSGTAYLGGGVWYELYSGSIHFVDDQGNSLYTILQTQSPFNALGRQNRVRYDSPSINGLVFSASADNGHAYEGAIRYSADLAAGTKLVAGVSYADSQRQGVTLDPGTGLGASAQYSRQSIYGGSASLLLSSGLNFTVSYGHDKTPSIAGEGTSNQQGFDATNVFGQVGYIVGKHHLAVNYGQTKDLPAKGVKGSQIGLVDLYSWTKAIDFYASYHYYKLTLPSAIKAANNWGSANAINQVFVGTRITFM